MKKFLYSLFFLLFGWSSVCFGQPCHEFASAAKDQNGDEFYSFNEHILVKNENGQKQFAIHGFIWNNTVVILFDLAGQLPCVDNGAEINITFSDGTSLASQNSYSSNCERKSALYFNKGLNNLNQLEILKTKAPVSIKVNTTGDFFLKGDFDKATSNKFMQSVKCLSDLLEVPLPEAANKQVRDSTQLSSADTTKKIVIVEQQPEFKGGYPALMNFINKSIKHKKKGQHGLIKVGFIVTRDGSIKDAEILQGISPEFDAEVLRAFNNMPKWRPGLQNGKPVEVRFIVPIKF